MPTVTCPSCGEKGKIPSAVVGSKLKCRKCGTSFLAAPAVPKPLHAGLEGEPEPITTLTPLKSHGENQIVVDGLDESSWSIPTMSVEAQNTNQSGPQTDDSQSAFAAHVETPPCKQYRLLTPKDKYFEGKFDLEKLEQALNHFAKQGWVVRAMSTPHVAGFSGGDKEQIVVVLER